MIVVIADDLTGAAELGGIGLRYGLRTKITTDLDVLPDAELLVIALDTRSKPQQEAEKDIEKISRKLLALQPKFIFKKIDSVLRGHVLPEIKVQMQLLGKRRALIVSANPALDRTIVDGTYLFKNKPIHESSFAHDPEFPIASSLVTDILRTKDEVVHVLKSSEVLPAEGFIVGEVQTGADLASWAKHLTAETMAVGAAGFFEAILLERNYTPAAHEKSASTLQQPFLFVCGTTFQKSRDAIKREKEKGGPVSYMPGNIIEEDHPSGELLNNWTKEITSLIRQYNAAIVAIDPQSAQNASAYELRERIAVAVANVLQHTTVHELFMEGGSTAAAILRRSGISLFQPVEQLAPGVIRMQAGVKQALFFTLKPGSYDWPANIPIFHS
jgi:uncharacterized protein YgbK (DUF1537 family)